MCRASERHVPGVHRDRAPRCRLLPGCVCDEHGIAIDRLCAGNDAIRGWLTGYRTQRERSSVGGRDALGFRSGPDQRPDRLHRPRRGRLPAGDRPGGDDRAGGFRGDLHPGGAVRVRRRRGLRPVTRGKATGRHHTRGRGRCVVVPRDSVRRRRRAHHQPSGRVRRAARPRVAGARHRRSAAVNTGSLRPVERVAAGGIR
jgi:hypothetical protein